MKTCTTCYTGHNGRKCKTKNCICTLCNMRKEKPIRIGNKLFSREMLVYTHISVLQDMINEAITSITKNKYE